MNQADKSRADAVKANLELAIITYNRARFLDATLQRLADSPFRDCRISVFDNASSDNTPEVCARHAERFTNFHVVRYTKNVGACANYLRAVENSRSLYTWVICDDDHFEYADCDDVLDVLAVGTVDLVNVGITGRFGWERGAVLRSKELVNRGAHYYFVLSFLPNLIFRTALFDSRCFARGYRNIVNSYPHLPFLQHTVDTNCAIYVSRTRLCFRGESNNYFSGLEWFSLWANSCRASIPDDRARKRALYDLGHVSSKHRAAWGKNLAVWVITAGVDHPGSLWLPLARLFRAFCGEQLLLAFVIAPVAIGLAVPLHFVRFFWRHVKGKPPLPAEPTYDFLRL